MSYLFKGRNQHRSPFLGIAIGAICLQGTPPAMAQNPPPATVELPRPHFLDQPSPSAQPLAAAKALTIQVTPSGPATLGAPISIAWTFRNTTGRPLTGSVVYYIDSNPVSATNLPTGVTIANGGTSSGTHTFSNPGPGSHWFGLDLLDRTGPRPATTHQVPIATEPGGTPHPVSPPPTGTQNPPVTIAAEGAVRVDTSAPLHTVSGGIFLLRDSQKVQLLQMYAPLLLFSFDHSMEEQYAPVDVVDFIHASTLESKDANIPAQSNEQLQNETNILNPAMFATINSSQLPPTPGQSVLPRSVFLTPSFAAQNGSDWNTVVMPLRHVGLYGHIVLQNLTNVTDNVDATGALPQPGAPSVLEQELATLYNCKQADPACLAQIIKIEYWQFFGYSHDFQDPASPIDDIAGPVTPAVLAGILDHSGDWCSVQLYVDAGWAFSSQPDKAIVAVYHYAHGLQFGFDMSRVQVPPPAPTTFQGFSIQELDGPNHHGEPVNMNVHAHETDSGVQAAQNNMVQLAQDPASHLYIHPVAYVEWGGHEFFPTSDWGYELASKHNGAGKYHYIAADVPNIGEIGDANPPSVQARLITNFAGYWGNVVGPANQNGPPQGPPLHKQWMWDPIMPPDLLGVRAGISSLPF
jgi:hypothetical protein